MLTDLDMVRYPWNHINCLRKLIQGDIHNILTIDYWESSSSITGLRP
ncbi:MAG: hypothetical protein H8E18_03040 [FCB group bacterium]|nr:hypothetical protein [FCB group bacterium]